MLGTWFGKSDRKKEARRETFVPRLEALEDRLVPAAGTAILVVPGINNSTLAIGNEMSAKANLGFNISFYGNHTSSVFVNTDGNITTSAALTAFVASRIPTSLGQGIIAPFYADVDTTAGAAAGRANSITYGTGSLGGHQIFAVTWTQVGYFNNHTTPLDTFQLVLINRSDTGPGNFDIEFNYGNIQ